MFLMQSVQTVKTVKVQTAWRDAQTAVFLLWTNFAVPFMKDEIARRQDPAADALSTSVSISVWSFWLPAMLGVSILAYGIFGRLSMRFRSAKCLVPFAAFAVTFLMWQVEMSQMISSFAYEEEFKLTQGQTHLSKKQTFHYGMFKQAYDGFSITMKTNQCELTQQPQGISAKCMVESFESKMMEVLVSQFCRPRSKAKKEVTAFQARVEVCVQQGKFLEILPDRATASLHDEAFCRCRAVMYDVIQAVSKWAMVVWFAELLGVCGVFYIGVEANLARMDRTAQNEILGFAGIGITLLVAKVMMTDGTLLQIQRQWEETIR